MYEVSGCKLTMQWYFLRGKFDCFSVSVRGRCVIALFILLVFDTFDTRCSILAQFWS